MSFRRLLSALLLVAKAATSADSIEVDVCVFGGTSGGVAAAIQAARMNKSVVLLEPGRHVGGMTASGLGAVDIGDPRSVGGIAREYFSRLVATYGKTLVWDRDFQSKGGPATGGAYSVEPHTAERTFLALLDEAKVRVIYNAHLSSVKKDGARLVELSTKNGDTVRARMFIDTTYEGDLMARAGVSYTVLREGNAKYGETHNGIHYSDKYAPRSNHDRPGENGRTKSGQGVWDRDLPLDPYVIPGKPESGLLPLVQAGDPGTEGDPAPGVQAYCFRLCLTTREDRIPIDAPPGYDPARYELVARFIAACVARGDDMDLRWFSKHDPLPNDKWDFNTATLGGNLPGANWDWPEGSYARRAEIYKEHELYHRGLLYFLANDERVPPKVRADMRRFGLPRDEFTDNGGWPHQIYVREGRRMVSDLVLTEHHTFGKRIAPAPVGLGSYGTDTHEIRRIARNGVVTREGKTGTGRGGFGPYQIGYGSIVPRASECENLFVTFALSASHTAFSSIRMEPVFMVTSQSAATAACLAIDAGTKVQDVDYTALRERLLKDGQVLTWPPVPTKSSKNEEKSAPKATQTKPRSPAAAVAVSPLAAATKKNAPPPAGPREAVQLARDSSAAAVNGKNYDLIVVGATAGGVATAVRAAREGCSVLLVQHNRHIGGMMINGLMQWDALYGGPRAPLFTELLGKIEQHYIRHSGRDSQDHQTVRYTHEHYPISWAEPHVAEREFNRLVAGEKNITLLLEHYPVALERDGTLVKSVTLRQYGTQNDIRATAAQFADGTYEGDLFALAKVPYRVGREARDEFDEPHAGKVFVNIDSSKPASVIAEGLNISIYSSRQGSVDASSPFSADGAVQAYNYRFCVTSDPENRIPIPKPESYRREEYVNYERKYIASHNGPNRKSHVNSPILPGENHAYPEADWPTREKITRRHLDFGLGLMWFLQNDPSVPEATRVKHAVWGLPKDEFADNGNVPYEMYVREARRIAGRHVLSERDGMLAPGHGRTPIFTDSIAITDWYMDSHSCTTDSRTGFKYDGKLILTEESRPSQIPYRCLLPREVDNLLVPVCLSSTHVAWGAVRLEPVWIQTGEAAGFAAGLAKSAGVPPAKLDPEKLLRTLVERRMLVSFFNDIKVDGPDAWIPALQYFATKGFFHDFSARMNKPLRLETAKAWSSGFAQLRAGKLDPNALAQTVAAAEKTTAVVNAEQFAALMPGAELSGGTDSVVTRGSALLVLWNLLNKP